MQVGTLSPGTLLHGRVQGANAEKLPVGRRTETKRTGAAQNIS